MSVGPPASSLGLTAGTETPESKTADKGGGTVGSVRAGLESVLLTMASIAPYIVTGV